MCVLSFKAVYLGRIGLKSLREIEISLERKRKRKKERKKERRRRK